MTVTEMCSKHSNTTKEQVLCRRLKFTAASRIVEILEMAMYCIYIFLIGCYFQSNPINHLRCTFYFLGVLGNI